MLQTVVNLALQIQRDAACDERDLRHRDRELGRSLTHLAATPVRQLSAWLQQVSVEEDRHQARDAARAMRLLAIVLFVLGSLSGSGAAVAAFYYDGRHPINILPLLAVFVLLPVVMLLPFSSAVLARSWVGKWPVVSDVQEAITMMLVGIMSAVIRLLPQMYREALQQATGRSVAHRRVYGRMQKWMLLRWSQTFVLGFMLAAVTWFGYRLVVTDLAFTWSTTLQAEQSEILYLRVQRLTDVLSAPWAALWPQARPSAQLIRDTHYFRLREGVLPVQAAPAVLGGWWPFLMLSMVCYGLLPRVLTWLFCAWRFRHASRWCLLHTPGVVDVLDRLNSVMIETQAPTVETAAAPQLSAAAATAAAERGSQAVAQAMLINWSAVPIDDAQACELLSRQLALDLQPPLHAGGRHTLEADAEVIAQVQDALRHEQTDAPFSLSQVIVLVKAWEPPMMEIVDFLCDLRQAIGGGERILIVALQMPPVNGASDSDANVTFEQWQRKLTTIGDPWLKVRPLTLPTRAMLSGAAEPLKPDKQESTDA
jgi:hypothetical protein